MVRLSSCKSLSSTTTYVLPCGTVEMYWWSKQIQCQHMDKLNADDYGKKVSHHIEPNVAGNAGTLSAPTLVTV